MPHQVSTTTASMAEHMARARMRRSIGSIARRGSGDVVTGVCRARYRRCQLRLLAREVVGLPIVE